MRVRYKELLTCVSKKGSPKNLAVPRSPRGGEECRVWPQTCLVAGDDLELLTVLPALPKHEGYRLHHYTALPYVIITLSGESAVLPEV